MTNPTSNHPHKHPHDHPQEQSHRHMPHGESHNDQPDRPIDIHRGEAKLSRDLETLRCDERLLPANRCTIERFVTDARSGRAAPRGVRRRLSPLRCGKLLCTLRRFALELSVPFEEVDEPTMERFILGVEDGTVTKLVPHGASARYRPDTVLDFRKIIRKFYRWLLPDEPERVEALTGWFDTRERRPELHTFGLPEAQRMARAAGSVQGAALILLLFDGGFRAGELCNVRLRDVLFQPETGVCFVRIRISKTRPRTISLPLATEAVRFWVERHPHGGPIGPDGQIRAAQPEATLLTWSYNYCRKVLHRLGREELGQRLYFHRFRHASATHYARRLSHYQLTARFGWSMGSRAVQRYIDHSGVLAEEVATLLQPHTTPNTPTTPTAASPAVVAAPSSVHARGAHPEGQSSSVTARHSLESLLAELRQHPELAAALKAALK